MPWLRPDGKTQVTIEYKKEGGAMIPIRVHTILISTQHSPDVTNDKIHADLMEYVIKPVVPSKYMDDKTIFHLNPSGAARPPAHDDLSVCPLLGCVPGLCMQAAMAAVLTDVVSNLSVRCATLVLPPALSEVSAAYLSGICRRCELQRVLSQRLGC